MKRTTRLTLHTTPLIAALGLAVSGLLFSTPAAAGLGNNIQYYLNGNNGNATFAHGVNPTAHGNASPNGLAHAACVSAVADCVAPPPPGGGGGGGGNPGGGGGPAPNVDDPTIGSDVVSLAALNGFCVTDDSFCKDNNLKRVISRDSVIDEVFELSQL